MDHRNRCCTGYFCAAIAGGMAEENHSHTELGDYLDDIALDQGIGAVIPGGNGTHQEWLDDFLEHEVELMHSPKNGHIADAIEIWDKLGNAAVFADVGPTNFKMGTAIQLLRNYKQNYSITGDDPLDLIKDEYHLDYHRLAEDLSGDKNGIPAKLWGLIIQEAEQYSTRTHTLKLTYQHVKTKLTQHQNTSSFAKRILPWLKPETPSYLLLTHPIIT